MNFQSLNFDYVEQPRPYLQNLAGSRPESNHSDDTLRPEDGQNEQDLGDASTTQTASQSPQPTVIPHAPSPPSLFSSSDSEIYGPARHAGTAVVAQAYARPVIVQGPLQRAPPELPPPVLSQQPPGWEIAFNATMLTDFRDNIARLAGAVTPGVDDTPYIQYALEALTRDRDTGYSGDASTPSPVDPPVTRYFVTGPGSHYQQHPQPIIHQGEWRHTPAPGPGRASTPLPMPIPVPLPGGPLPAHPQPALVAENQGLLEPLRPNAAASADSLASTLLKAGHKPAQPYEWAPMDRDAIVARIGEQKAQGVPALSFRPLILRTGPLLGFAALCLLMTAALIFSAVYSERKNGLLEFSGLYGGRYFLFRMFPALLAAVILLWAQFIITSIFRILPFARLASGEPEEREGAIFEDLYITSFIWPRLVGPWQIWVPTLVVWLMNFTLPLQSSLFTVIYVGNTGEEVWKWAAVQGVAWTLVALYLVLAISVIIVWIYWANMETTGLMWDARSLADITAIISDTNTAEDYKGTQIAGTREGIRFALRRQTNLRLGYWTWRDGRPGFWYTLGTPSEQTSAAPGLDPLPGGKAITQHQQDKEKQGMMGSAPAGLFPDDHDVEASIAAAPQARHRYLPWCLRTSQLIFFTVTAFFLLLALLVVCFLPSTRITAGFIPGLSSGPKPGAFSPADFLYSFLPSLLGTVLFLLFQPLDITLRVLQPWAALSSSSSSSPEYHQHPRGARAEQSLLADYAACAPLQGTLRAFSRSHWRVAAVSLLATLLVLVPVLAGGMLMALTGDDGVVRIDPNVPALAIVLALLALCLCALLALLPDRADFRLPHAVTCLAEIVSFLANENLLNDLAFKQCRSRTEMLGKMGVLRGGKGGRYSETGPRWLLGITAVSGGHSSQDEGNVLGVRRASRFTEKRKIRKSQISRGAGGARGFLV